jgi:hypothetical protein
LRTLGRRRLRRGGSTSYRGTVVNNSGACRMETCASSSQHQGEAEASRDILDLPNRLCRRCRGSNLSSLRTFLVLSEHLSQFMNGERRRLSMKHRVAIRTDWPQIFNRVHFVGFHRRS